jgi:hypothetical protein
MALDELTSGIVNHDCFWRLTGCDLQKKVMNCLALAGSGITQKHDVFSFVSAWNSDPGRGFFKPKIVSDTSA